RKRHPRPVGARAGTSACRLSAAGTGGRKRRRGGNPRRAAWRSGVVEELPPGAARQCRAGDAAARETLEHLLGPPRRDERPDGLPDRELLRGNRRLRRRCRLLSPRSEEDCVMKRFHVHAGVTDLEKSISFYSKLFGAEPTVVKPDYAKWMLEDPRINFAISQREGAAEGIEHVGLPVEDKAELAEVYERLQAADRPVLEEGATTCCYARSEKSWIADPDGVMWEAFLTEGESTVYGGNPDLGQLV